MAPHRRPGNRTLEIIGRGANNIAVMAQRPAHLKPPAYLSPSPPVPVPGKLLLDNVSKQPAGAKEGRLEPTRYGDWERNGLAVDF
jgi:hypothetical protein